MANVKTVALTRTEYQTIIKTILTGFTSKDGVRVRPNERMATILTTQANVGMRIGDILELRLADIIKDGNRYRLDVVEDKTDKARTYTVPTEIYLFLLEYANKHNIKKTAKLFDVRVRVVQKHITAVVEYLGLERVSTHSFRKFYATEIYNNNQCNIELVRELLQHVNTSITQKYIGISSQQVETAIANHVCIVKLEDSKAEVLKGVEEVMPGQLNF